MFWWNQVSTKLLRILKGESIAIANARSNTTKAIENTCTITKKSTPEKSGDKKSFPMKQHEYKAVAINSITLLYIKGTLMQI